MARPPMTPRSPHPTTLGALAICVAAALWGLDGVVLTPRLAGLPVVLVVLLLHAVPFLLMLPVLGGRLTELCRLDRGGIAALFAVALAGGLVGTLAIVKALFLVEFNQLSVVVLLQKLQPVFALGLARVILGERLTPALLRIAAVALSGAYLLAFGLSAPEWGGSAAAAASAWAVLAAAAFGSATVLGKRLLADLDFRTATCARYGVTAVLALGAVLAVEGGLPLGRVTGTQWALVVVIGLTTGSGAIFLYYWGLSRVKASVATLCELFLPLTAVLLDRVVNGSTLDPWQWLGAVLLVGAIVRLTGRGGPRTTPRGASLQSQRPHREGGENDPEPQ